MKLFYLADGSSIHTRKWIVSLMEKGYNIHLFSLNTFDPNDYLKHGNNFSYTMFKQARKKVILGGLNKLSYLNTIKKLRIKIKEFAPDIVHAHFGSSYGMLAAWADVHPLIISVWGYDVFVFPKRSFIHKQIIIRNLSKADKILSTSHEMAKVTKQYTSKPIEVTPFGIDTKAFKPSEKNLALFDKDTFVIGTAKALEDTYAIDDLIKAFSILVHKYHDQKIKLLIAGEGSARGKLEKLTQSLKVDNSTLFLGHVEHNEIPKFYNTLDVFSALSLEESFGVSVIEAGACAKPVVVTNVGGLPEVVDENVTGFIVPVRSPEKVAGYFEKLLMDKVLRDTMGRAGREKVESLYDWNVCVDQMDKIYRNI